MVQGAGCWIATVLYYLWVAERKMMINYKGMAITVQILLKGEMQ
jgi:hypothetical protein